MKIFATGDTHGNFERFRPEYFPEGLELTKACGSEMNGMTRRWTG